MKRRLVLKKEALAEISSSDLHAVAGGQQLTPNCPNPPTTFCPITIQVYCITQDISRAMDPCLTYTCV